ncbi:MAG: hypothetical protein WC588_03465 [Candidatus Micrarchaeia archaeon]
MGKASASCPSYVTGVFCIAAGDAPGAGFAIDKKLTTTVSAASGRTTIFINGSESPAPVSKAVMRRFVEKCGRMGIVEIRHEAEVPIGFGLGMSAAGALSLSLALNEFLGAGLGREECVKIAHDSDVECGTGLSGVDAAAVGGILVRRSLSKEVVRLPFEEKEIEIAFFSPIRNAAVLKSREWQGRVNAAGEKALGALSEDRNWDGFVAASRQFAKESLLADWCKPEMEKNSRASMAMLGQTLFSDMPLDIRRRPKVLIKAKTSEGGAELL